MDQNDVEAASHLEDRGDRADGRLEHRDASEPVHGARVHATFAGGPDLVRVAVVRGAVGHEPVLHPVRRRLDHHVSAALLRDAAPVATVTTEEEESEPARKRCVCVCGGGQVTSEFS